MRASWHALHAKLLGETTRFDHHHRFRRLTAACTALARFADTTVLLDHQRRDGSKPEAKDDVLRALVAAAQDMTAEAQTAQTVLLLALWPGLDAVRARLSRFCCGNVDELAGDILARAIEAAARMDLARVNRVAATLLRNIERDLKRSMRSERLRSASSISIGGCDENDADTVLIAEERGAEIALDARRLPQRLQRLIGTDAGLVMAVAIEGFTQAEVGAMLGIGSDATRKRYQRAIVRLRVPGALS